MKRYGLKIIIIFIILLFQIAFNPNIKGLSPDFLLIYIFSFSILGSIKENIIISSIAGLTEDLFSGAPLGFFLFPRVIISYILSYVQRGAFLGYMNFLIPIIIFLGSLLTYEIEFVFAKILNIGSYSHITILKLSFINFLFSPVSYLFLYIIQNIEEK